MWKRNLIVLAGLMMLSLQCLAQFADKTIGVLVYEGVLTSDVVAPLEVFGAASRQSWFSDYQVLTIGIDEQPSVTTEEGLRIGVDYSMSNAPTLDVLIVPSRYEMDSLIRNKQLIAFILERSVSLQWLASNCSGALLLAEAGLLNGKRATTWAGGERDMQRAYPEVQVQEDMNFILDGNILTSNGGVVSYQAALKLLEVMSSSARAKAIEETLQFNRIRQSLDE